MKNALLFPGQGAQRAGMLDAFQHEPAASSLFTDLHEVLGLDPAGLHSSAALKSSRSIQLALFFSGVASYRILAEQGATIDCVAGFSIGAFSAAVACGAFTFRDLLPIVALRGEAMERAFPNGYGMLAVVGAPLQLLIQWISTVDDLHGNVYLANINSSAQVVFSGKLDSLEIVAGRARELGFTRVQFLDVPTPSHSPLLSGVSADLFHALSTVPARPPTCSYLSNTTTRIVKDSDAIRHDLMANVSHPIHWRDGMELLLETGIHCFVESLPSDVLTRLGKEVDIAGRARWISIADKGYSFAARQLHTSQAAQK